MNRYHSYLNTAEKLISLYKKGEPLHWYLKKNFSANKKMGSKDRKLVADLCYAYFRVKPLMPANTDLQQQLLLAAFLCGKLSGIVAESIHPEWVSFKGVAVTEKMKLFHFAGFKNFPFYKQLSNRLHPDKFAISLLHQPKVFIRIRSGYMNNVTNRFQELGIAYEKADGQVLSVAQGIKLDGYLKLNKEAVIQDLSSSQVFDEVMPEINKSANEGSGFLQVWDVCAASGGKSILFHDLYEGSIKLTVSDIRVNMLSNLTQRLAEAGIKLYRKFSADISVQVPLGSGDQFDVIICDVPCSGSGTWARTPEQYAFYEAAEISRFAELQRKITLQAARFLKQDGWLIYITCSAFATENEHNIRQICEVTNLVCTHENYLTGYEKAADTLYCAVLRKSVNPS